MRIAIRCVLNVISTSFVAAFVLRGELALACGDCLACRAVASCAVASGDISGGSGSAANDVIISEIMYNPVGTDSQTGVGGFNREWVEIYNAGVEMVDLSGWTLGDSQDNDFTSPFPNGTRLQPKGTLVITGDGSSFLAQWNMHGLYWLEVTGFPNLANSPSPTNETVALRDAGGVLRDQVNYDDENGWPRVNGNQGQSIFLLPSGLSAAGNDIGSNWAPSIWGTYGARFSSFDQGSHGSPGVVVSVPQAMTEPSADAVWSMVVIPDSQNYSKSSVDRHVFTQMTEWIRDNKEEWRIGLVLHEGDIVNNNNTNNPSSGDQNSTQQWQNAQTSMHVLNGHLPYILAAGNHDFGTTNAQNRSTQINTYFKPSDNPFNDPAQGGILAGTMNPGEIQNAYYDFTAPDGRKLLVLSLEFEPRPSTVAWANQIAALPEYADHTAVLLTHSYLTGNNTRPTGSNLPEDASGEDLWQGLVSQHENFEMVFNGHFGGDQTGYLKSTGIAGNSVHQMFFNTQHETYGGDGWFRMVEFLEDGKTARVRAFSPLWDLDRPHPQFEYTIELTSLFEVAPVPGDYNGDGVVNAGDYTLWRDSLGGNVTIGSGADGNGNRVIDLGDYEYWRERFGDSAEGSGSSTVPEPALPTMLIAALTSSFALSRIRNRSLRYR